MSSPAWLGPFWAAIATAGFAVLFNLRGRDIPLASAGGALGWALFAWASRAAQSEAVGYFCAAAALGLWAEVLGAALRRPATVYVICGIIPLVPGGGMYYSMLSSLEGSPGASVEIIVSTLMTAFALAAGLAAANAIARLSFESQRAARPFKEK